MAFWCIRLHFCFSLVFTVFSLFHLPTFVSGQSLLGIVFYSFSRLCWRFLYCSSSSFAGGCIHGILFCFKIPYFKSFKEFAPCIEALCIKALYIKTLCVEALYVKTCNSLSRCGSNFPFCSCRLNRVSKVSKPSSATRTPNRGMNSRLKYSSGACSFFKTM